MGANVYPLVAAVTFNCEVPPAQIGLGVALAATVITGAVLTTTDNVPTAETQLAGPAEVTVKE